MTEVLDDKLFVRVQSSKLAAFKAAAKERYGMEHADLIRELMDAATDGRVKITPTDSQKSQIKAKQELYTHDD